MNFSTRTGKRRTFSALLLAAAVFFLLALWWASNARCFALVGDLTCRVKVAQPLIALTFDDGPTAEGTRYALQVLREHDATATFFLTGQEAAARPELVRDLLRAGHEIGNHSYSHRAMIGAPRSRYRLEIERADRALRAAGVPEPRLFRPPYGKKLIGLPLAVREAGYRMIMWDVEDPRDAEGDPRRYAQQVIAQARPGSIILMHVMYRSNETARAALPMVIDGLKARGFRIVPVGELLAHAAERRNRTR